MSKSREKLFTDFPPVTTEEWMERVTVDLKGADFERRLVWKTNEGFNINPFYRAEDIEDFKWTDNLPGEFPYVRGTETDNEWYVRKEIEVEDFAEANKKALTLLEKGVTSFGFTLTNTELTADNISTLLRGIAPDKVELNFNTCINSTLKLTKLIVDYITNIEGLDLLECHGSIEHDPFRKIFKLGRDVPEWKDEVVEIVKASAPLPRYRVISITGDQFADAGSYLFQELGYSLSYGNEILSTLIEKGVDPSMAAKKIKFKLGVGANYFMEIAKFRAARWLWAEIVKAYNPPCVQKDCDNKAEDGTCRCAAKINVHAVTSSFNTTVYDAYVNLLRTQTEAMSASLGGVDSLTVRPFNHSYQEATDFTNRLAVNQQLLLKEESHFDKVTDPGAGSYYIEKLTKSIGEEAWKLFLNTDEKGFYAALKEGAVQDSINGSADARFKAASHRKEVLLGTNQFPSFGEKVSSKLKDTHDILNNCVTDIKDETPQKRLNTKRLAEPFEAVRLATEKSGKTPKAFMLTIGNLTMRLARSQFSGNFLASAGYEIIDNLGFETVEEGVKAAREQNADIIVLCSSDKEYAEYAPEAYKLIKDKEIFVIAGAPSDDLKAEGIEYFINVRSNVLDMLTKFNTLLDIK
ncbi:MAG TPA: methylmalonyl-CoA mutase family protein [Dysgonamonadaceae bacterium]|nr:methylmalonyl-CoA mutase family protein [Dysgonamonadaceae bacterium]